MVVPEIAPPSDLEREAGLELETNNDHLCIYIAGMAGSVQSGSKIKASLEGSFGKGNVDFWGSALWTKDAPIPHRFDRLTASLIDAVLYKKKKVTLVGHSLGAAEGATVLENLEEAFADDPDTLRNEILPNINIVLMAPAGFIERKRENIKMIGRLMAVLSPEASFGPDHKFIVSGFRQGIESIVYLPVDPTLIPPEAMQHYLEQTYQDKSHFSKQWQASEQFTPQEINPDYSYFASLPKSEQQRIRAKVADIDEALAVAAREAQETGSWTEFKSLLRKRGRRLKDEMRQAWDGGTVTDPLSKEDRQFLQAQVGFNVTELLWGVVQGKTHQIMKRLLELGVDIKFIIPQFDSVLTKEEAIRFYGDEKTASEVMEMIVELYGHTHSSVTFEAGAGGINEQTFGQMIAEASGVVPQTPAS